MHVIGLLLIIILIYLAIVHWYITVPLLLFLVYLGYIYIPQKPKKHPVRFHTLWQFTDKHILVKCLPNEYTNTLYLFHPIPLLQKIEAVHQKELDEEAEEKQREAEIAAIIAERERLKEEQQRQKELLNQKLQESL